MANRQAVSMAGVHVRLIRRLEQDGSVDHRKLEARPSDERRRAQAPEQQRLLAPELATLMAHVKIGLYQSLLESDVPEDSYLGHDLERYFPDPLPGRYRERMREHRLRREIIATVVANQLVDRGGTTFVFRLAEETGADVPQLARAYAVAREVFEMRSFWHAVEELDNKIVRGPSSHADRGATPGRAGHPLAGARSTWKRSTDRGGVRRSSREPRCCRRAAKRARRPGPRL